MTDTLLIVPPFARHRHYKGGLYDVIGIATHSETRETLVLYRGVALGKLWARPLSMWSDLIDVDGQMVPRFAPVEAS